MKNLTICIPVFNALQETMDCVESILQSDAAKSRILLMDDGSTSNVASTLREQFKGFKNIEIHSNFRNRGYTKNCNFAFELCDTEFICLLNSDTLVPRVWATPLINVAQSNPQICAVGPSSNAASYQSFPQVQNSSGTGFSTNDEIGFRVEDRENMCQVIGHFAQNRSIDFPILNGFCTIFKKKLLDKVGALDEANFPQGYGEENDLCARIKAKGFRLHFVPSVFVHHQKSKSFGEARKRVLSVKGREALNEKYHKRMFKNYVDQMENSVELNPLRQLVAPFAYVEAEISRLDLGTVTQIGDQTRQNLFQILGPARVTVSSEKIKVEKIEPNRAPRYFEIYAKSTDELIVDVPKNLNFPLDGNTPIATTFRWLSFQSHFEPVLLRDWEVDIHDFDLVLQSELSNAEFKMMFFATN